ncbi:MAG: class I SAM-dependent methyltransferase [Thermoanaerobaculia bacterium]|nr:class I SAM-dependent methyltransferase [Thermoanaerobaculia bacterium]
MPQVFRPAVVLALRRLWRLHGLRFPLVAVHRVIWFLSRTAFGPRRFTWGGRNLRYFLHPFLMDTERCVEVPIARDFLEGQPPDAVLEVGNVLSTYQGVSHRVLDLYEQATGVVNEDAADFAWTERFDRIVCLSTVEHVGRDEPVQDPEKAERALRNLRRHLTPDGQLLVTFPLGYHPQLDQALASGRLGELSCIYLRRMSRWNSWTETDARSARGAQFGSPYPCGNVVAVLRLTHLDSALIDPLRGDPFHGDPFHGDPFHGDPVHGDPFHGDLED